MVRQAFCPDDLVVAIQDALTAADEFQNEQVELYRKTEIDMEARNLALGLDRNQSSFTPNTVRFDLCAIRDVLKGQFLGSEKSLGNWGFTVNQPRKKNVIPMPRKAPEIIDLAKNIIAKHVADGPASILPSTMMDPFIILTNRANDKHNSSDKSRKARKCHGKSQQYNRTWHRQRPQKPQRPHQFGQVGQIFSSRPF